ncbi:MAG: hypothetical protein J1E41_05015 [Ruminococcus sp.]|nr:hypothetical protein [Ruminococcus sp.]
MEINMNNDNKAGNFLNAINKYNEEERAKIVSEIETKKADAVKNAEAKGRADADKYVKKHLSAKKSEITGEYAVKNLEAQGELFKKRDDMVSEIFKRASDKLNDFTASPQYKDKLISYAKEIADIFKENSCTVYVKKDDLKYENDIKAVFNSEIEVESDIEIRIGGLRGFCKKLQLVADNTLDSKLENQKNWFIENADLKIS